MIKQNKLTIDRYLDLHNYTLLQAEELFINFIYNSHIHKYKLVLVITGKGKNSNTHNDNNDDYKNGDYNHSFYNPKPMGVIKNGFFKWLEYNHIKKYVISYSTALPKDGGEGAFYLRIRS